ncbi:hypothetical protein GCHA_0882 [Paraglaciecola chathamensis S18K6]|uniref:Uncharacterized protein n=2 Tax=Paraglaciecola chathamensis TaxID=368405 RepID=A0ABQ0I8U4_9ALTE|nr:hypothetical protein GAGA_2828 [Paraglaciecola agarilytica NO2]GAC08845.1 hypothetical protein GCHA_0882 [Paraglaciecola chathamensis S18K6]
MHNWLFDAGGIISARIVYQYWFGMEVNPPSYKHNVLKSD